MEKVRNWNPLNALPSPQLTVDLKSMYGSAAAKAGSASPQHKRKSAGTYLRCFINAPSYPESRTYSDNRTPAIDCGWPGSPHVFADHGKGLSLDFTQPF